jgi:hypothetical protein
MMTFTFNIKHNANKLYNKININMFFYISKINDMINILYLQIILEII